MGSPWEMGSPGVVGGHNGHHHMVVVAPCDHTLVEAENTNENTTIFLLKFQHSNFPTFIY